MPLDRETYLIHLRREPDFALKMLVFDMRSPLITCEGVANILSEALLRPEAAAFEDIEDLRRLVNDLLQSTAKASVMLAAAADFAREQAEQRLAQNKKDMGEE